MRRGFTLVELLIVMAILIILAVIAASNFNSIGVFNKARDAQRKKDLSRIRVAFEEYYNDKGCYPDSALTTQLNLASNCGRNIFSPWLSSWPCDPNKTPYQVRVGNPSYEGSCSKWYKIVTKLENEVDANIPAGWEYLSIVIGDNITSETANYGVSSSNINWYDVWTDPECAAYGQCFQRPPDDPISGCGSIGIGCVGPNCFVGLCQDSCRVSCCGAGCN